MVGQILARPRYLPDGPSYLVIISQSKTARRIHWEGGGEGEARERRERSLGLGPWVEKDKSEERSARARPEQGLVCKPRRANLGAIKAEDYVLARIPQIGRAHV